MHPQPPSPYPVVVPIVAKPTSGLAVASLTLGIFGLLGGWCLLGIPCLLAVVFGHLALPATRDGRQGGRGAAVAGLVLGYVVIVPAVVVTLMGGFGAVLEAGQPKPVAKVTECSVNDAVRTANIHVTVTNKSNQTDSYTIRVSISDANGTRVGDGTVFVMNVAPGQSAAGTGTAFLDVAGGSRCSVTKVE